MPQETRTLGTAAREVASSAMAVIAKLAALSVVVGVTVVLFVGPACGCSTKASAYRAAMKSDLRLLSTAQEIFFSDSLRYGALSELDYTASEWVTVQLTFASDSAWSASASHMAMQMQCTIFIGNIEPPVPHAEAAVPICDDPS